MRFENVGTGTYWICVGSFVSAVYPRMFHALGYWIYVVSLVSVSCVHISILLGYWIWVGYFVSVSPARISILLETGFIFPTRFPKFVWGNGFV